MSLHIRNIAAVRQFALLYSVGLSKNAVFHGIPQNGHFKKEHHGFGQPAPFMWENTDGPTRCQPGFGNLWFLVGCIGANGTCRFGAACLQSDCGLLENARIMIGVEITLIHCLFQTFFIILPLNLPHCAQPPLTYFMVTKWATMFQWWDPTQMVWIFKSAGLNMLNPFKSYFGWPNLCCSLRLIYRFYMIL